MLFPNVAVTSTRQQLGVVYGGGSLPVSSTAKPGIRQVNVTNNGSGSGTVYVQLVATGTAPTLTTSTYTFSVPAQPNPYEYILTPGLASLMPQGFDIWIISNTTATVNVQTVPF
jgi:hypothetical protein